MQYSFTLLLTLVSLLAHSQLFQPMPEFPTDGQFTRGVAWGDLNGDGWPELVAGNEAPTGFPSFNLVYWNIGGKRFEIAPLDTAHIWTEGIYLVDVDNDYDLDIFATTQDDVVNPLYLNDGKGNFTKADAGDLTRDQTSSPGSCWCDLDADGDLDVFLLGKELQEDILYLNDGHGKFKRETKGPWVGRKSEARACVWGDLDGDNRPDLYVNNYVIRENGKLLAKHRNFLYLNKTSGFVEVTECDMATEERAGYGVSIVDLESDGDLDIYVSNISMSDDNNLYRNNGKGEFENVRDLSISTYLRRPSKGHFWNDLNNDGLIDLYLANGTMGAPVDYPEVQNYLFLQQRDSSFKRIYDDPSVMVPNVSAGTAGGDFDRDGDIDIFVGNWGPHGNDNAFYINNTEQKNWIAFRLVGTESNSYGIGSTITLTTSVGGSQQIQKRYHYPYSGYGSMSEPIVHFGLNDCDMVLAVEVAWPNGSKQHFKGLAVNQVFTVHEKEGIVN